MKERDCFEVLRYGFGERNRDLDREREREGEELGFGILEGWGFAGVFTPYNGFPNYGR